MFPLGGEESVDVMGQSGRESMMSKPFDQALANRVEIAMFGRKESAVFMSAFKNDGGELEVVNQRESRSSGHHRGIGTWVARGCEDGPTHMGAD